MMTDWLFSWRGMGSAALFLTGALILAIVFREGTFGNVASILGLAVSILGFVITIWTVLDARQQIQDAGDRATDAIAQAREETRRVVGGIAAQLFASDCAVLRTQVEDLRQAAQDGTWPRAVYRCQESRSILFRLAHDARLTEQEKSNLRLSGDELQDIRRFIEDYRLGGQSGRLKKRRPQASGQPDRSSCTNPGSTSS
jgi:hypothetical protein